MKAALQKMRSLHRWIEAGGKVLRAILCLGISYIILNPIFLKLSVAFKDWKDVANPKVIWIPANFTLDNIKLVTAVTDYMSTLWNTFMLSSMTTVLQVVACALAGYAFARYSFRGISVVFMLVVLTIVVPPQTLMVPTYLHFRFFDIFGIFELFGMEGGINLLGSYWPFALMSATAMGLKNGLFIFIFRQVFKSLPNALEEAAFVDGSGHFKTFYYIMVPSAIPAIITVILFSFVWQWNDLYHTSMFLTDTSVLSTQLMNLTSTLEAYFRLNDLPYDPRQGSMLQNTFALLVIAPLLLLYLFAQRHFVEGVARSGIVG